MGVLLNHPHANWECPVCGNLRYLTPKELKDAIANHRVCSHCKQEKQEMLKRMEKKKNKT